MDINALADPAHTHVLDRTMRSLESEKGWTRTIPRGTTRNGITVPSFHELISYIKNGNEGKPPLFLNFPEEHEELLKQWQQYFQYGAGGQGYANTHNEVIDNLVMRFEVGSTDAFYTMRLSAQEIIDMDMENAEFFIHNNPMEQFGVGDNNVTLAAIGLTVPAHVEGRTYTPLHASTLLFNNSYIGFSAVYDADCTYGETLAYIAHNERMDRVHSQVDAFYKVWNPQHEKVTADKTIMERAIRELRGHVPSEELILWAATTIKGIHMSVITRLAELATVEQVFDAVFDKNDPMPADIINKAAIDGVDWDLLAKV